MLLSTVNFTRRISALIRAVNSQSVVQVMSSGKASKRTKPIISKLLDCSKLDESKMKTVPSSPTTANRFPVEVQTNDVIRHVSGFVASTKRHVESSLINTRITPSAKPTTRCLPVLSKIRGTFTNAVAPAMNCLLNSKERER